MAICNRSMVDLKSSLDSEWLPVNFRNPPIPAQPLASFFVPLIGRHVSLVREWEVSLRLLYATKRLDNPRIERINIALYAWLHETWSDDLVFVSLLLSRNRRTRDAQSRRSFRWNFEFFKRCLKATFLWWFVCRPNITLFLMKQRG